MVRLLFILMILLLSGCAPVSQRSLSDWDALNYAASQSPGGSWFVDHDAMRHMRCFPAYCH